MKELKDMTFGFVGLGLMGGSIAKGIKDKVFKANYSLGKNGFENDSSRFVWPGMATTASTRGEVWIGPGYHLAATVRNADTPKIPAVNHRPVHQATHCPGQRFFGIFVQ